MVTKIGIVGGSGIYKMGIIKDAEQIDVETPFGKPSSKITVGTIDDVEVAFIPRHGENHKIPPHNINYRANIFALKECGVEYLISTAAVGSLKEEIKPLDFVVPNQFFDRTLKRKSTFFDSTPVVHVALAEPFCPNLSKIIYDAAKKQNLTTHVGTYICMEGPQFSTKAESNIYRKWGVDVIGMTLAPEAKLAREAEMCLGGILSVTDYDCWHEEEKSVSVTSVVECIKKNDANMANLLKKIIPQIKYKRRCDCKDALATAFITPIDTVKEEGNPEINRVLLKKYL